MRILVTGASGQVGSEIVELIKHDTLHAHHEVHGFDRASLDIGDRDAVEQVVGAVMPDAIVNCAAYTDVDGCEGQRDRAWRINALAVRHVAVAARRVGAHVVHISTDYVFPGDRADAYHEWDEVGPRSVYGASKLGGERELVQHADRWTLVRTSWVFGRRGKNFVDSILTNADAGKPLRVVEDQIGCPTYAPDLAAKLVRLAVERREGLFHVTNQGSCTWRQFAKEAVALWGLDPERVGSITSEELARPAPRPANSVLANSALEMSGLPLLRHYQLALKDRIAARRQQHERPNP